jgi:hypothetical protein
VRAAERFGAQAQIRLAELAISRKPPGFKIMAAMTGHFDDSRTEGLVLTVSGFVGGERHWEKFERDWKAFLERHGVPYFHMKEFGRTNGPYKKWLPAQDHIEEIAAFFSDLVKVIRECRLKWFGSTIRIKDLERFNKEKRLSIEPYSLAVYACMLEVGRQNPDEIVDLFFDRIEKVHSRLEKAEEYAKSDKYHLGVTDLVQPHPLNRAIMRGLTNF